MKPEIEFVVEERKLLHYLLDPAQQDGKAQLFALLGFTADNWEQLRDVLVQAALHASPDQWVHVQRNVVKLGRLVIHVHGFTGRKRNILTIWQDHGPFLRLISAYPAKT